jgi:hypothetical protein
MEREPWWAPCQLHQSLTGRKVAGSPGGFGPSAASVRPGQGSTRCRTRVEPLMVRIRLPRRSEQSTAPRISTGSSEPTYSAFISYSHAVDGKLAPALQSALHGFARPWNRLRALRVFRDEASLSANPALWSSIERALHGSAFFILLASPEAAGSRWVNREIDYWLRHKSRTNLLIMITDGEAVWDEAAGDFDWDLTTAVPRSLKGIFEEEPRYIDLRWARLSEDVSLHNPRFRDAVADLEDIPERLQDELSGSGWPWDAPGHDQPRGPTPPR